MIEAVHDPTYQSHGNCFMTDRASYRIPQGCKYPYSEYIGPRVKIYEALYGQCIHHTSIWTLLGYRSSDISSFWTDSTSGRAPMLGVAWALMQGFWELLKQKGSRAPFKRVVGLI